MYFGYFISAMKKWLWWDDSWGVRFPYLSRSLPTSYQTKTVSTGSDYSTYMVPLNSDSVCSSTMTWHYGTEVEKLEPAGKIQPDAHFLHKVWITAMLLHLCIMYGCFHALLTELSSCKLKTVTIWSLKSSGRFRLHIWFSPWASLLASLWFGSTF